MRIVFMGTPDFAVPCLRRLAEDGHELLAVFTQPDKPQGRKMILTPPPVKTLALELGLPVFQPTRLRDGTAAALLRELAPELIVVVAYGRILPKEILEIPPLGCINIHGSLLPKFRGAAPIQWTVLAGEKTAGVTSMYLAEGMDTGDMLLKTETPVDPEETAGELFERLAPMGADCLSQTVCLIERGEASPVPQDEAQATYAPMLDKAQARIDLTKPAVELHNLVRGMNPWPGAWLTLPDGKKLKVHRTRLAGGGGTPGCLLDEKKLILACGTGALELIVVQPEGKRSMSGEDFLRGLHGKVKEFPV